MKNRIQLSAALVWILHVIVCQAQGIQENLWMPNGTVHATALSPSGDTLYIGGEFSYIGPYTGNSALLATDSDTSDVSWPKINGSINSVIPDGFGGWFVGGKFTQVGNIQCNNLVHIKNDNSIDQNFLPIVNSIVLGIYLSGKTVYVRGEFNKNAPKDTNYLTAYNAINGNKVNWNLDINGEVTCFAVKDSIMYVSGSFTKVNGDTLRKNIASFHINTWRVTPWKPKVDSLITSFKIHNLTIYTLHTTFDSYNYRSQIGMVDLASGLVTPGRIRANGLINSFYFRNNIVYLGGHFTKINDTIPRIFLAAINLTDVSVTDWKPILPSGVSSITSDGNRMFVCGAFRKADMGVTRNYLAAFDLASGVLTTWNPGANSQVSSLVLSGKRLFAGGSFTSAGGVTRNNLAAIDLRTGIPTNWNPNIKWDPNVKTGLQQAFVKTILVDDSLIYVGGSFTQVNEKTIRKNLAAFDIKTGVPSTWYPEFNGPVNVIAKKNSVLYVGGDFTYVASYNRGHFASFNLPSGTITKWDVFFDYQVKTLAFYGNTIIVGGAFSWVLNRNFGVWGSGTTYIAAFDLDTWYQYPELVPSYLVSPDLHDVTKGSINSIIVDGEILYLGGQYKIYSGQLWTVIQQYFGVFSLKNYSKIDSRHAVIDQPVHTMALSNTNIYLGGDFTRAGDSLRTGLLAFDKKSAALTSWKPNTSAIRTMIISPSMNILYVGGGFNSMFTKNSSYFLAGLNNPKDSTLPVYENAEPRYTSSLIIYPNPAHTFISVKPIESDCWYSVELYSVLGEKVYSENIFINQEQSYTIDIQKLPIGSYTCRIVTPQTVQTNQLLIVR